MDLGEHLTIVGRVDHYRHAAVVLGCCTQHGRAADVDVFDRIAQGAVKARDGLGEGIEIDHQQVDRPDAVMGECLHMLGQVAACQQATVHLGMQGFDPAIEHFGKTGVVGYFGDREPGLAQQFGGASGREQADPKGGQLRGQLDDASLVGNADQGLLDRVHGVLVAGCSEHPVELQLLAKRVAVDAEHHARTQLVALRLLHHDLEHRALDG